MPLVEKLLLPKLLYHPPDGFHIIGIHGLIVVGKIHPAAHAGDDIFPFLGITEDDGAARFVELSHTEIFDFLLP